MTFTMTITLNDKDNDDVNDASKIILQPLEWILRSASIARTHSSGLILGRLCASPLADNFGGAIMHANPMSKNDVIDKDQSELRNSLGDALNRHTNKCQCGEIADQIGRRILVRRQSGK